MNKTVLYLLLMCITTYLIRVLPLTLIQGKIKNNFIQSFLYYVPYVTLTVMTFPAILSATQSLLAGVAALAVGIFASWKGIGLFPVALCCCITVFILELF